MNAHTVTVLARNLVNAYVATVESAAGTTDEAIATGALFATVRLAHQLGEFASVVAAAAEIRGVEISDIIGNLPSTEVAADFRTLMGS